MKVKCSGDYCTSFVLLLILQSIIIKGDERKWKRSSLVSV